MPRYLVLNRSGVHRAACFALFRALLRQGPKLHLDAQQLFSFNHIVKDKFRKHVKTCSPRDVKNALELGYKSLRTLLTLASSNRTGSSPLSCALDRFQKLRTSRIALTASSKTSIPALAVKKKPSYQPIVKARPNTPSVLSRPFLSLSGPRHVPKLVNANGIPFLRFKKPQSPYLSRIIRDKIKSRLRRFDQLYDLKHQIVMAKEEDHWDKILYETCGLRKKPEKGRSARPVSWMAAIVQARDVISTRLREETLKNAEMARKMHGIVEQEKTLAAKENAQGRNVA